MGEVEDQKTLTLAEQYSLPQKQELADQNKAPAEVVQKEVAEESDVTTVTEEKTDEAPAVEEKIDETPVGADKADDTPPAEESSESPEPEESDDQEAAEQKPEIKLETAPADFRFPTTNQSRHCFTRYIEYHRCVTAKGDGAPECDKFAKYYRSLCPGEWVDRWNEQRENGTFPGPL